MPRFLAPITVAQEFVTGNETISGNETVLGATSGRESYWTEVSVVSGLSANYGVFVKNVSANAFYGDGRHLTIGNYLSSSGGSIIGDLTITGTFSTINTDKWQSSYSTVCANSAAWAITSPTGNAGGDLGGTYPNPTVAQMQGYPISTATPSMGQMLQWSGTAWVPANIPNGGSGGGGVVYYLNYGLSANNPIAGLSGTHYELGRYSINTLSAVTFTNVSQTQWDTLATFVTDNLDPNVVTIAAGIWDLNFWASSTASIQSQMTVRYQLYTYHESLSSTTLIATSDTYNIYDPSVVAQYVLSMVVPQTSIDLNDRIFLVLQAQSTSPGKNITIYYNDGRPTHLHTTIPSVGGSGLVKVVNGVYQNPASLLVDVDVASNAQINQTKISGLTASLDSKFDKSGGTVSGNLTVTGTFSTTNTNNWNNTYNTVNSNSAKWESVYTTVNSNSSTYVTLTGTQTLKNKIVVDWMTLVRGYNTTPTLLATIGTGDVYTYVYNSSPSNITYYRYIATDGSEDSFYSSFNGTSVSGLVASKSITI